ncbi:MAG TPA: M81 family metallopeptidase [Steroidobacteraceae bacterium]|nr:M81 family metallopeptidase [Steroidobacteraceae bacterium]
MARIAVGGFQHETNTFAPLKATLADFEQADAWPGLVTGPALFDAVKGINLPAAGFINEARSLSHELVPLLWCSAQPSAHVARDAFETIMQRLLTQLSQARSLDAVYLDLHGAMVAEHIDDADGEVLARVRKLIGPGVLLVASLDFHANVSARMVEQADGLVSFRSYPHIDMTETGVRAAALLHDLLNEPARAKWHSSLPFLMPLTTQCTLIEPLYSLMAQAQRLERAPVMSLCLTPGFPAADVPECGPAVFGFGRDADSLAHAARALLGTTLEREHEFALDLIDVSQATRLARDADIPRGRPVILADTQDNPGAGGNADTMSLLKALVAADVEGVLAGVIWDAECAARAHEAGQGATIELALGARSGFPGESALVARFTVERLGDGRFTGTGPFYHGGRFELGPMALLRTGSMRVVVASRKQQAADAAMFRHVGAEPADARVLVLKSSVHFRADFGELASRIVIVEAPGPNVADPSKLPFTHLPPDKRLTPRARQN